MLSIGEVSRLIDQALLVQNGDDPNELPSPNIALQELVDNPSDSIFEAARDLCRQPSPSSQVLGARILKDLGAPEMPFAQRSVIVLLDLLREETDPEVLQWVIGALGGQHDPTVTEALLPFLGHPDSTVRDAVAGAVSASQNIVLSEAAILALCSLADDPESEVRLSAIFELNSWFKTGQRDSRIYGVLKAALEDDDPRIVRIAATGLDLPPKS